MPVTAHRHGERSPGTRCNSRVGSLTEAINGERHVERPVRHLVRVTSGAITLVVMLLLIQITMAPPAFAASISISPSSGLAGSSATITGTDFLPLSVQLCWDGENCTNLGTATPGATGEINVGVTIPSGAPPGRHTVSACQLATGCTSTVYDVTDSSTETSAPTTSTPTTTASTVTTTSSTTTTMPSTTSTRPNSGTTSPTSPPTTTPGTTSTVPTPQTTTAGTTPDSSVTTTTTNNSTTTTDGSTVLAAAAGQPPAGGSAPFSLDLSKLRFGIDPDAVNAEGEPPPESTGGEGPLAAAVDGATVSQIRFGTDAAATPGFAFPRIGIWLGWLVLVVGSFVVIVGFEEVQRRKEG
jgi:hypothetical protein